MFDIVEDWMFRHIYELRDRVSKLESSRDSDEPNAPEPKPSPDYKLEAGCKVICEQHHEPEILTATVLSIDGGMCFLRYADGGQGCYPSSALTVTAPATPEAGDYVQLRNGKCGMIDCCSGNGTGGAWRVLKESRDLLWYHRSDFTIICKARSK